MVLHCLIFMGLLRYSKLGTWLSTLLEQAAMKAWNEDWDTEPSQTRHCKCNANFEFLLSNPFTLLFWCHFLCFFNLWQGFHLALVEQCFYNLWKAIGLSSCWTGSAGSGGAQLPLSSGETPPLLKGPHKACLDWEERDVKAQYLCGVPLHTLCQLGMSWCGGNIVVWIGK